MLRFAIAERDQSALPPIDLAGDVVIGSGPSCGIRLPAAVCRDAHMRIGHEVWTALADAIIDGAAVTAGASGTIGTGVVIEVGTYRIAIGPAPPGALASPPQRTESLARELVRSLLGSGAAPTLEIVAGPHAGAKRALAPPESTIVIGRGDEATWVIVDAELSRTHAEIKRGWDGAAIVDLDSKRGTRVNGARVKKREVALHDGDEVALGPIVMRFRDPAERHVRGEVPPPPAVVARPSPWPFVAFAVLAGLAVVGAIWILAG